MARRSAGRLSPATLARRAQRRRDGTPDARADRRSNRDVRGPAFAAHGRFHHGRSDTGEEPRPGASRPPARTIDPGPPAGPILPGIAGGAEPCDPGTRLA